MVGGVVALGGAFAFGSLDGSFILPQDHPAIQYGTAPVADRVSVLQRRLLDGNTKLAFDERHGYLPAVLRALDVPVESQVLVFSKTSFQAPRISPRMARAIYFTDDVYVGWVPGGDVVEIAAVDPALGVIFYALGQDKVDRPKITRRDDCLQCHASGGTLGVPGLVVRSVYVERSGMPFFNAGGFVTDHRSPLTERWGGWYVTGTHGAQRHMGNVFAENREHPEEIDRESGANVTDLKGRIDTGMYLAPTSDLAALMVLEHQTRMTNLITRVGWETRLAVSDQLAINRALGEPGDKILESSRRRIDNAAEELLKYLLFADEAVLKEPVRGGEAFAKAYSDSRPFREFDMRTRMFRNRCSPLIMSEAFDGLPAPARERVYRRLWEVLTGADTTGVGKRIGAQERKAIYAVLLAKKRNLPEYWRAGK